MHRFFEAALGYPTALFSFALLVVAGYWGLVLLGGLGVDLLDGGTTSTPTGASSTACDWAGHR
ncbi:hypothetical protein [Kitasatospora cheerisanensis]|uniref:Uncharacterized protein n=1 Tax=Kitasatospora cheerisanensis KCTC 2395 TaxID=1348663 RepID=A0A066YGK4_9ACTN|nr:hypothetical protein [Kitasatospora cheerisanensis]KDN80618.1 hypothetical protein KCH_76670 [Kitasatospora cheerisanensis KCTC 2395]